MRTGKGDEGVEVLLVFFEPWKSSPDDEPTHGVSNHADLGDADVLGELVVHFCSQTHAHGVDVTFCSTLVG